MVKDNVAPPMLVSLENTEISTSLVILGLSSLYHLTCREKEHDGESCLYLVSTGVVPHILAMCNRFKSTNPFVIKLCSLILVNFALESGNHERMIKDGVLSCVEVFQADPELDHNSLIILTCFGNTPSVLYTVTSSPIFDTYCENMMSASASLASNSPNDYSYLQFLSQVFLNACRVPQCCSVIIKKSYFEDTLVAFSLKTYKLNWNAISIINLLVNEKSSKNDILKTGCAGILSRVSQIGGQSSEKSNETPESRAESELLKKHCGKVLNSMSSRKSTISYTEGSIVACLSTFEEVDDGTVWVINRQAIDFLGTSHLAPPVLISECDIPKIENVLVEPTWEKFTQMGNKDVKSLPNAGGMVPSILNPPKVFSLQTNGAFQKIYLEGLEKVVLPNIELVSDDEEEDGEDDKELFRDSSCDDGF